MSNRYFSFHLFSHTENHTADSAVSGRHKKKAGALYGRLRRAAGFTLAELLVVIAIIGILAGFGFVAVIRYRKTLKQEELDATAREIFVAAQNHATVAKASGSWDHYVLNAAAAAADSDAETLLGAAMGATGTNGAAPADYTDDAVKQYGAWGGLDWLNLSLSSDHKSWATDHAFRAIRVNPEGSDNSANSIISLLLPLQSIDETLRGNGNIIIEYDAVTASVYAVWYSKDGAIGNEQYTNDNRKNKEERLKLDYDKMVGYYGGGVSEQDDPDVKELQPIAVTVSNNDELTLNIVNPNQDTTAADGKTARSYTISAVVTGETSGAVKNVSQGTAVSNRVGDSSGNPVIVQSSTNKTFYTCVLDNVNVNRGHFAELFSGTDSNGKAFIPGEDLSIKVTVSDSSNPALAQSATVHTNSLFASISGSATDTTAAISYARHLENLSSDVSKVNQSSTVISKFAVKKAVLNNDIDWAHSFIDSSNSSGAVTMGEGGVLSNSDSITGKNGKSIQILYKKEKADFDSSKAESSIPKAGQAGCYYGIQNSLLKNATKTVSKSEVEKNLDPLQTIDGNGHSIKNLKIQPDKAESDAGLISRYGISKQASKAATSSLTIQNVTLKDPSIDALGGDKKGDNYYGFFIGQAYQTKVTISNCKVDFTDSGLVNGGSRVSAFVANSSGSELTLQNLTLQSGKDLTIGNSDKQTSVQHAGGFVGYSASQKITIQNCRIQAGGNLTVAGETNAGGFVGRTTSDNENLTIQSSHIIAGGNLNATGSDYAGGIVGYTQAKTLSYKSSSIEVGGDATVTGKGAALGIGFSRHPDGKKLEEVTASNITISVKGATAVKDKGDSEERKEDQPYGLGVLFGGIGNGDSDTAAAADIKDINLDLQGNVSIAASGNAKAHVSTGVLVGDATNVNLTVTNSPLDLQSKTLTVSNRTTSSGSNGTNGTGDAGGMIGRTAGGSLSISGSGVQANNIEIDAAGDAGGLIGYSKGQELTIKGNGVTAADTLHVESPTKTAKFTNAGGIVGHANATSKAEFQEDTVCAKKIEIKGVMAGGMAGKLAADGKTENTGLILNNNVVTASSKLSVTAQSVSGSNDENNKATDSGFAGGLAGATYGQADIKNCYVFGGGNEDIVSGESWVGGLIGYCIGRYKNDSDGLKDHTFQQKIIIRNCAASTYVELTKAQQKTDAAGGLIGLVNCPKAGSEISNCYAGGRTRNGSYGTETDENTQGRFNVKVKVKAGNKDGAFAAGFIGRIFQNGNSGLTISSCYTTASVYNSTVGAEGKAGSFIGQIEGEVNQALKIEQCYTTGLVGIANSTNEIDIRDQGYIGTIVNGCKVSGSSNYYLKGVQAVSGSGDSAKTETQPALKIVSSGSTTDLTVEGKEKTDAEASDNPFAKQGSTNQSAAVYDSGLTDENQKKAVDFPIKNTGLYSFTYPYKTTGMTASVKYVITGSDGSVSVASNGSYAHIGDWPVPVEDTAEPALRIVNGSKLTALIAVDASSFSGSTELPIGFGVEGVTSGKTAFMQLKVKKETDGAYSVTAESESSTAASGSKAGVDISEKYKALTNSSSLAVRAYADLKKDFSAEELSGLAAAGDLVNGSDAVSPNAPVSDIEASGVRSRYQYLEIDLDDITTSGGNFASIFTGFIPGEDIRIYVAKDADTFEKVKTAAVGTDDSELTKKKTALKEKKTAYETAAAAAASSSATEAQKTAAATVLEEYQTAANDLFDHYSVVNSLFADGSNRGKAAKENNKETITDAYDPNAYNLLAVRRAENNRTYLGGKLSENNYIVPAYSTSTSAQLTNADGTTESENPTIYGGTALILNGRHLQNLSTEISGVNSATASDGQSEQKSGSGATAAVTITKASIRNDILWSRTAPDGWDSVGQPVIFINGTRSTVNKGKAISGAASITAGAFYGIENKQLEEVNGNGHTIANLKVQEAGNGNDAGLIARSEANGTDESFTLTIRELTLRNPSIMNGSDMQYAGFLIGQAQREMAVINCTIQGDDDLSASGKCAGTAVGNISSDAAKATLRNVTVVGKNISVSADATTREDGSIDNGYAGGMIGSSQSGSLTVANSSVTASTALKVTGKQEAGGLIGYSAGSNASLSDCHVIGGGTPDLILGGKDAGGMIGYIYCGDDSKTSDLKVTECSASVYVRQKDTGNSNDLFSAGGLIGTIEGNSGTSVTIDHSYAGGRTKDGKYVYDTGTEVQGRFNVQAMGNGENETYVIAGGLVGDISNPDGDNVNSVIVSDCYTTASVYSASDDYTDAGSFIGTIYSGKVAVHNNYSTGLMREQELGGDDNESRDNTSSGGNSEKETQGYGFIGDDPNIDYKDENSNYHDNSYLCGVVGVHIDNNGNKTETEPQQLLLISGGSKELDSTKSGEAPFTTGTLDSDNTASIPATAKIYDDSLKSPYPFNVTNAAIVSGTTYGHIGDWPKVAGYDISLDNGNKLELKITVPSELEYITVGVTGKTSKETQYVVIKKGSEGNLSASFQYNYQTAKQFFADWNRTNITNPSSTVHGYQNNNEDGTITYTLWLDDITIPDGQFAKLMSKLYPGEDISVTVLSGISSVDQNANVIGGPFETNSIYAYAADDTETTTALISNIRHLENLSDDISKVASNNIKNNENDGINITKAVQNSDIQWEGSENKNFVEDIKERNSHVSNVDSSKIKIYSADNNYSSENQFLSIVNKSLESYDAEDKEHSKKFKMDGLNIVESNHGAGGIFQEVYTSFELKNVELSNMKAISKGNPAGIIAGTIKNQAKQNIENVTLSGTLISNSTTDAGILVGRVESGGTLEVKDTTISGIATVKGSNIAGMVAANALGTVDVENLAIDANANVESGNGGAAGGLFGVVGANGQPSNLTVKNVAVSGNTFQVKVVNSYGEASQPAGGLIGLAYLADGSSISDVVLNSPAMQVVGSNAGGLVGTLNTSAAASEGSTGASVRNCLVFGKDSLVSAYGNAGGLVGQIAGNGALSVEDCSASVYVETTRNDNSGTAGGLIGDVNGSGAVTVTACQVGGHTIGGQYETQAEGTVTKHDRNILGGTGAKVGGFIGQHGGSGSLMVRYSYTTASVYGTGSNAKIGGFIGEDKAAGTGGTTISYCYATGRVSGVAASQGDTRAPTFKTFTGTGKGSYTNDYVLKGVNGEDTGTGETILEGKSATILAVTVNNANTPFAVAAGSKAWPYDSSLYAVEATDYTGLYPYMTAEQLYAMDTTSTDKPDGSAYIFWQNHYGDWVIPAAAGSTTP